MGYFLMNEFNELHVNVDCKKYFKLYKKNTSLNFRHKL
jgi:hypothetical protein